MSPIEFGDLPPAKGGKARREWHEEAEELRRHPGQWARITSKSTSQAAANLASHIRRGAMAAFRDGQFEATSRGCDVWVRHITEGAGR